MDPKLLRLSISAAAVAACIFLVLLWQPARQVRLHQAHLLRAVEKRDFARVAEFIAENYSDRWGHDKDFVLRRAREVFRHFVFSKIQYEEQALRMRPGAGEFSARIAFSGRSPVVDLANERVGGLAEPFTFKWEKRSWKPWEWQLVEVNQPELEMRGLE